MSVCLTCGQELPKTEQVKISPVTGAVMRWGNSVRLTPTEERLFRKLWQAYPGLCTVRELWPASNPRDTSNVATHVYRLTKRLAPLGIAIKNEHSRGYRIVLA